MTKKSMSFRAFQLLNDPSELAAEEEWSKQHDLAIEAGLASGNMMDVVIPGYGRMGDLKCHDIEDIIERTNTLLEIHNHKIEIYKSALKHKFP